MTPEQIAVSLIVAGAAGLFLWGRWRHDMVALAALLAGVGAGVVEADAAFAGFGHPAVITVACVLILSRGLQNAGAVQMLTRRLPLNSAPPALAVAALTAFAAFLSAFMNNVGALALLMPVGLKLSQDSGLAPAKVLMPLAFGSILGGMTTLIGTPPNLIVAQFRAEQNGGAFGMFDFSPVGGAVALAGVAFIALLGRWLVPARERAGVEGFDTGAYIAEALVPEGARAVGMTMADLDAALDRNGAQALALIRNEARLRVPAGARAIEAGDVIVIEAEPDDLTDALSALGLKLAEAADAKEEAKKAADDRPPDERPDRRKHRDATLDIAEFALLPDSPLSGRTARQARLRTRFGVSILALSRQGRRTIARLRGERLRPGDVALLQGTPETLAAFAAEMRAVPLADRGVALHSRGRALLSMGIMLAAVAAASSGHAPAAVAFAAGALLAMATEVTPAREAYNAVDWPVIVLLGALTPAAAALASTGAAELLASVGVDVIGEGRPELVLVALLVVTMTLSDFVNNAAVAAAMCPVAVGAASRLDVSADPFLMAVAVGASCAFLTPIGHQNNTLILGPSGLRFGDYWRLGLPLEILVVAVATPTLLLVWPL
ncbi:MAG: SLC13 family permease [Rubrimonas sp.]